ncbi:unnamed protein product [Effrenium voratum]|uniref:Serine hydrolase domain-containing protein n=1 Tax=Effrenium voratum TaxID=2562239 RepID=A0AA36J6Q7_9DINO|nr:unnamed protein product [Effrenium voratum]
MGLGVPSRSNTTGAVADQGRTVTWLLCVREEPNETSTTWLWTLPVTTTVLGSVTEEPTEETTVQESTTLRVANAGIIYLGDVQCDNPYAVQRELQWWEQPSTLMMIGGGLGLCCLCSVCLWFWGICHRCCGCRGPRPQSVLKALQHLDLARFFHPKMIFGFEDFGDEVPKSSVILERILPTLGLDAGAAIFADDDPSNVREVQSNCPGIWVVKSPRSGMGGEEFTQILAQASRLRHTLLALFRRGAAIFCAASLANFPRMDWDPFADPADAEQTPETRQAVTSAPFATQHEVAWAPPPLQRPIRVACLHGTCSNGNVTKVQLQRAAKMCGDEVEFIYLDGRMPSDPSNIMYEEMSKNFKGQQFYDWAKWITESDDLETDVKKRKYRDLDVRLDSIQDLLRQHEPLDGVLGFSQGANMASLLAAQAVAGQGVNFGFVIHCCPAGPGWVNQRPDLFPAKLPMRSLHISGEKDTNPMLPLLELYENPTGLSHSDGHKLIPSSGGREEADSIAKSIAAA